MLKAKSNKKQKGTHRHERNQNGPKKTKDERVTSEQRKPEMVPTNQKQN